MSDKINGHNPWKAFLPYDEESAPQFKGRTRNVEELFAFVEKERTTVCYADSGVGKSSLINAGLKPKLRQHLFFPVDIVFTETDYASGELDFDQRVILELEKEMAKRNGQSQEVKFQLKEFIDTSDEEVAALDKRLAASSLWWLLHTRKIECSIMGNHVADYSPIFIFDQFEELFTRSQHEQLIQSFFEWYPTASSDSISPAVEREAAGLSRDALFFDLPKMTGAKFLFSLRQDSMGTLDYWATQRFSIPSLRSNRYCLLPLTTEQAHRVITEQGVDTLNGVAEEIIQELKETNNDSVPAIMLSVFCNRLYEKAGVGADGQKIPVGREDISTNKERLIREYYEELLAQTKIDENAIFVIEDCLVSDTGKRNRVVNGSSESLEEIRFDKKFRKSLADCYLINDRGEYIEIAHDKVAEAIFVRKKERKLKKNLRKWRFLAFLVPFFLLIFSVLYVVIPSGVVLFSSHEFVQDDDEYFNPMDVNGDRVYLNSISSQNNSFFRNIEIDTSHYNWREFSNCPNLQRVKVEKIAKVGGYGLRFEDCPQLEQIDLADCVSHIDENFVVNCPNLKSFTISEGVESIDPQAFVADDLSFEVDSLNEHFVWDNGILWNKNSNSPPIVYIQETILNTTDRIPFAYGGRYKDSLYYRGRYLYPLDRYAGEGLIDKDSSILLPSPAYKFYKSIDLSRFTKVTEIPDKLFAECVDLDSVVLPPAVEKIGAEAFRGCVKLKRIEFPASLETIEARAFEECQGLEQIRFEGDKFVTISDYAFSYCLSLKTLQLPQNLNGLGIYAFADCAQLREVVLPSMAHSLNSSTFKNCNNLEKFEYSKAKKNALLGEDSLSIKEGCVFFHRRGYPDTFLWGINKLYTYEDSRYYSENGILFENTGTGKSISMVAWNEFSQFDKYLSSYGDYLYTDKGILWLNTDKKSIHLPVCLNKIVNYSFLKLPLHLKELHIPHPQPDVLSVLYAKAKREILNSELIYTKIRIELPSYIRKNVVLYVPYGCSKYYRNHPDYQGFKAIEEDGWWMRGWNEVERMFRGIASVYTWLLTLLSVLGIVVLCWVVYALGRSMDHVLGINRSDKRASISAVLFTMFIAPISFMGAYWFTWYLFVFDSTVCTIVGIIFCLLSVGILSVMQRMTPKELWKRRRDIGLYLWEYIKSSWIKWHLTKVLLIVAVWVAAIWGFAYYSEKRTAYIQKVKDTLEKYWKDSPSKAISYAYESQVSIQKVNMTAILTGHSYNVNSATFSPDGKRIVTASWDNTAMLWDAETGEVMDTLKGHSSYVNSASFSPDGKRIVTASDDNTAMLWDADTGEVTDTLKGHSYNVNSATFSPDGKRIVTASDDNTAMLWDAETGEVTDTLKGHSSDVRSASFSPDGKRIVTASSDDTAMLWDVDFLSGEVTDTLKGHSYGVNSASFSPDGKRIVTASGNDTAMLWNAETGEVTDTLKGHRNSVLSASFSPDGKRMVTASADDTAIIWILDDALLIDCHKRKAERNPLSAEEKKEYGIKWWLKW